MRTSGQACDRSYNDLQDTITETVFTHANVNINQHHIACRKVNTKTWGNAVCNAEFHNQHKCHKFILCLVSVLCRNQLLQNCSGNDEGTLEVDNNNEKSFGGMMSHTHKQGVGLSKNLQNRLSYSTIAIGRLSVAILVMKGGRDGTVRTANYVLQRGRCIWHMFHSSILVIDVQLV